MLTSTFNAILAPYKTLIETDLSNSVQQLGPPGKIRDACQYALLSGGKRFRPILVLMIAKALGHHANVLSAALGIEFLHTASLIADDLPCMDNDAERRNQPSVHCVYGEDVALLSTYALIAAGYGNLAQNTQILKNSTLFFATSADHRCTIALQNVSDNTGLQGVTGGQFLDIYHKDHSIVTLMEIMQKKTATLFEVSFTLGWLFGGGALEQLSLIKQSANHFGIAFQLADDLEDMLQDQQKENALNVANILGKSHTIQIFEHEIAKFEHIIAALKLDKSELQALTDCLVQKVQQIK